MIGLDIMLAVAATLLAGVIITTLPLRARAVVRVPSKDARPNGGHR